eukprot:3724731-Pyramimonas_sp.AAC.1
MSRAGTIPTIGGARAARQGVAATSDGSARRREGTRGAGTTMTRIHAMCMQRARTSPLRHRTMRTPC